MRDSGSFERGITINAGGPSTSKLLNYRQIKLVKVQDNKFVNWGYNLSTFEKPKRSEEHFNFIVGDSKSNDD